MCSPCFGTAPLRHLDHLWPRPPERFLYLEQMSLTASAEPVWRSTYIMAEKSPSKDASPVTASKVAGNPALRMMGASTVKRTSKISRLMNKTCRTAKHKTQATLSQLAYLLDHNGLIHFDASVRPLSQEESPAKMVHFRFSSCTRTFARQHDAPENHHLPDSASRRWTPSISRPFS